MALQTSGLITHTDIQTEFGGSNPISMDEYYGADLYNGMPSSGEISADDFYGKSVRTAKITCGRSSDSIYRYGYSAYAGSSYYEPETGESQAAFGSITRSTRLINPTQEISAIVMEPYETNNLIIAQFSSTNGNWNTIYFKDYTGNNIFSVNRTDADGFISLAGSNGAYGWKWSGDAIQPITNWLKDGYTNNTAVFIKIT